MSDPTLYDNDFKNKMAWVLNTLNIILFKKTFLLHCYKVRTREWIWIGTYRTILKFIDYSLIIDFH